MPCPQTYRTDHFVIRFNLRSHLPKLCTVAGHEVTLMVGIGQREVYHQLRQRNQVSVNIIGLWRPGMCEPLWVMSRLAQPIVPPEQALAT